MPDYDVIVLGLGAMGSAAIEQLSRTSQRVLGIEQFTSPHNKGSSHGETRIIRLAYFEAPVYVPLLKRAYTLWQDLETRSGNTLLHTTGGIMIGPHDATLIQGTLASVKTHKLSHQYFNDYAQQQSPWKVPKNYAAVYETQAGFLKPEDCIRAFLTLAKAQGATLWQNTKVTRWQRTSEGFTVETSQGTVSTKKLVLTTGAWMPETYTPSRHELKVTRQSLFWFKPPPHSVKAFTDLPIFLLEMSPEAYLYGFPLRNGCFKVALHQPGETIAPDVLAAETVSDAEINTMQNWLNTFLKTESGPCINTQVCLYTNTPDGHFRWYEEDDLMALSACSGHGFKFASVMGELVKKWAQKEPIPFDLSLFTRQPSHKTHKLQPKNTTIKTRS